MTQPNRSSKKYLTLQDGQRFEINLKKHEVLRLACCDCGLVHDIAFAIEKNGNIGIAMRRNPRSTAAKRRGLNRSTHSRPSVRAKPTLKY